MTIQSFSLHNLCSLTLDIWDLDQNYMALPGQYKAATYVPLYAK
jgi:hypothetical protein